MKFTRLKLKARQNPKSMDIGEAKISRNYTQKKRKIYILDNSHIIKSNVLYLEFIF